MDPMLCVLLAFVICVLFVCAGSEIGRAQERAEWRSDLIKRGLACWKIDPKTGEKRFAIEEPKR